jgi:hypothetical protein
MTPEEMETEMKQRMSDYSTTKVSSGASSFPLRADVNNSSEGGIDKGKIEVENMQNIINGIKSFMKGKSDYEGVQIEPSKINSSVAPSNKLNDFENFDFSRLKSILQPVDEEEISRNQQKRTTETNQSEELSKYFTADDLEQLSSDSDSDDDSCFEENDLNNNDTGIVESSVEAVNGTANFFVSNKTNNKIHRTSYHSDVELDSDDEIEDFDSEIGEDDLDFYKEYEVVILFYN